MIKILEMLVITKQRLKKCRYFLCVSFLLCITLLSGCSSMQLSKMFQPVNMDTLSVYKKTRLNCSIQTGLQSETDFAILATGIVSFGIRLPSSVDQDFNYDRRLDDYHDCLRIAGL